MTLSIGRGRLLRDGRWYEVEEFCLDGVCVGTEVEMPKQERDEAPQAEQVAGGEVTTTEVPGRRKVSGEYLVYQAPEGQDFTTSMVRAVDAYAVKHAAYPSAVYVAKEDTQERDVPMALIMGDGIAVEVADFVEPGTVACKVEHEPATPA